MGSMQTSIKPSKVEAATNLSLSTWLWDTATIQSKGNEILSFLEKHQVNQVFLQVNNKIPSTGYKAFIAKATSKNIKVHALDGAPDWVGSKGETHVKSFFDWVKAYQKQALPNERFAGIHLDVEPYLHSSWNANYSKAVISYQTLLTNAKKYSQELTLPLGADIPFWFDEKTYNNKLGKGDLASWVIRTVDYVSIMAYRDQATGPNGIIELAKNEVLFATSLGKPVIIGVETGKSEEANYVSFYEEGQTYMFQQLEKVRATYSTPNVSFAIHYLHSWMAMKP